ncbi:MAG: aminotransferase class I/II-fold pyridoxal phosphate-dependent enzyme [Flavobacteriales bacterium]|nr:aminotransferase class I/II-fold pyridoxal phosphate-dependent enzyme [Flavobacteriales bacterium]
MHNETKLIRTQIERSQYNEHSNPIFMTSSYVFDSAEDMASKFSGEIPANIYSRYSNPNVAELIQKVAQLEETESGWATATGMSAIYTTFMALLSSGDHIVSSRSVFGSTHQLFTKIFPKFNITTSYAEILDIDSWEKEITENTKILYLETPSNPGIDLADLEKISILAKKYNLLVAVDNCFSTPYLQIPKRFGADIIIHSATKHIDGQGRTLGGLILSSNEIIAKVEEYARHSGPAISPFNAWILSKSLETLHVRIEKHSENALKLAQKLEQNPNVELVKYPFLESFPQYELAKKQMKAGGGIVTFYIKGGLEEGKKFINSIKMCSVSANLGDTRTIVTHPASTTHAKLTPEERNSVGITDNLIRVSVGLEHEEDIINDIENALLK